MRFIRAREIILACIGIIFTTNIVLGDNSTQNIVEMSVSIIEDIYDIAVDDSNCSITEESYTDGSIDIIFTYSSNDNIYRITYDKATSAFLSLTYDKENIDFEEVPCSYDQDKIIEQYMNAQNIYYSIFGDNTDFVSSAYQFNLNENNEIAHGNVNFFFENADGDALKILYNVKNDIFWQAVEIPYYTEYLRELNATSDYRKQNNIERIFIELS